MCKNTKCILADSFKNLLKTYTLNKITIKALVDNCNLNRQTFYYHFKDIYDLIHWIISSEIDQVFSDSLSITNWNQYLLELLKYFHLNKVFYLNIFYSLKYKCLEEKIVSYCRKKLNILIEANDVNFKLAKSEKKFLSDFYSYALTGIFLNWIKTGINESPEKMINIISRLTPKSSYILFN